MPNTPMQAQYISVDIDVLQNFGKVKLFYSNLSHVLKKMEDFKPTKIKQMFLYHCSHKYKALILFISLPENQFY